MDNREQSDRGRNVKRFVPVAPAESGLEARIAGITPEERRVLGEVWAGKTYREIATLLIKGEATVKSQVISAFDKLGVPRTNNNRVNYHNLVQAYPDLPDLLERIPPAGRGRRSPSRSSPPLRPRRWVLTDLMTWVHFRRSASLLALASVAVGAVVTVSRFGPTESRGVVSGPPVTLRLSVEAPWPEMPTVLVPRRAQVTISARQVDARYCPNDDCLVTPAGVNPRHSRGLRADHTYLVPGLLAHALICRISSQGVPFDVGTGKSVAVQEGGKLFCSINDARADDRDGWHDNRGTWEINVEMRSRYPQAWQPLESMPLARAAFGAAALGNQLFVVGGYVAKGTDVTKAQPETSVWAATLAEDGTVRAWREAPELQEPRVGLRTIPAMSHLYAVSGKAPRSNRALPTVERARLAPDGSIEAWSVEESCRLPEGRYDFEAVVVGDRLYLLGGDYSDNRTTRSVVTTRLLTGGGCTGWAETTPMTSPRVTFSAAHHARWLYAIGGFHSHNAGDYDGNVERAPILADGLLGPWQPAPGLPHPLAGDAAAAMDGTILVLGGAAPGAAELARVYEAYIDASGDLVGWREVASMTTARTWTAAVVVGSYLYAVGGAMEGNTGLPLASVERMPVAP